MSLISICSIKILVWCDF